MTCYFLFCFSQMKGLFNSVKAKDQYDCRLSQGVWRSNVTPPKLPTSWEIPRAMWVHFVNIDLAEIWCTLWLSVIDTLCQTQPNSSSSNWTFGLLTYSSFSIFWSAKGTDLIIAFGYWEGKRLKSKKERKGPKPNSVLSNSSIQTQF